MTLTQVACVPCERFRGEWCGESRRMKISPREVTARDYLVPEIQECLNVRVNFDSCSHVYVILFRQRVSPCKQVFLDNDMIYIFVIIIETVYS